MRVLLAAVVLLSSFVFAGHCSAEDWTPPENPDPTVILNEAKEDARNRRYEDALAKHVWYHNNALQLRKSLTGVRLSFALSAWLSLAEKYPPALEKMSQIRDETEERIRNEENSRVEFGDFHDFVALNKTLRDNQRTVAAFQWLDGHDEADAGRMFGVAQPALIELQEYALCGKYLDPEKDSARITRNYNMGLKLARERFGERHREYTEKKFLNDVTTLVAILVQNERTAEAAKVAQEAKELVEGSDVEQRLEREVPLALEGMVPKPWP